MVIIPFAIVAFWGLMLSIAAPVLGLCLVLGGVGAVLVGLTFCWGFTNVCTFLYSPRYYRLWKKGMGEIHFLILYLDLSTMILTQSAIKSCLKEAARQQADPPPTPPDPTRGIDDLNILLGQY